MAGAGKGLETFAANTVSISCVVLAVIGEKGNPLPFLSSSLPSFLVPFFLPSFFPCSFLPPFLLFFLSLFLPSFPLSSLLPFLHNWCCYGWVITFMQRAVKEYVSAVDAAYGKQFEEFTVGFEGR